MVSEWTPRSGTCIVDAQLNWVDEGDTEGRQFVIHHAANIICTNGWFVVAAEIAEDGRVRSLEWTNVNGVPDGQARMIWHREELL